MRNKNICRKCMRFKTLRFNLFKKDITHPRIYFIHCGLAPILEDEFTECEYFEKKELKHRLGIE